MAKAEDLTGQTFGQLLVVARAENNQYRQAQWLCLCECGEQTVVVGLGLRRGNTRSCGCSWRQSLEGQTFGRLKVLSHAGRDKHRKSLWACVCSCGTETVVAGSNLAGGRTQSCGCLSREATSQRSLVDLTGQVFTRLLVLSRAESTPQGRSQWLCRCDCGAEKVVVGYHLKSGATRSCGCLLWSEVPTYVTAHQRVYAARGKASTHPCVDCGSPAADEWSYQGGDPNEFTGTNGKSPCLMAYSGSPEFYAARCRSCHKKFDKEQRTRTTQSA